MYSVVIVFKLVYLFTGPCEAVYVSVCWFEFVCFLSLVVSCTCMCIRVSCVCLGHVCVSMYVYCVCRYVSLCHTETLWMHYGYDCYYYYHCYHCYHYCYCCCCCCCCYWYLVWVVL